MEGPGEVTGSNAEAGTPQYFGEYEVMRSIGRGKFAIVYRAQKIGDTQTVALKRISVDMMNDKAREKCLKEVRLLQSLDHPNIIRYMDSFICDNDLIIVYEWAAAGDLKRQLRKAQERGVGFEERVVWKYFSQICSAMKYMHEKRVMHRDLKPANIFLTLDGTIKVGDLGLSRELSEHTIQAHSKVGTPLYMSPEVLKGDGYDFKSDIWSLGCLLYELALLRSPFKAEGLNLMSLFQKISNGEYQPLPDTYSEELRTLAYSMISTRPEDRPEIGYVCEIANAMRDKTTADRQKLKRSMSNTAQDLMATVNEINRELNINAADGTRVDSAKQKAREYAEEKKGRDEDEERVRTRTPNRPTHSESQNTTPNNNMEKRNPFSRTPSNLAITESPRKNPFGREAKKEEEEDEKGESSDDTHNKNAVHVDTGYTLNDYFQQRDVPKDDHKDDDDHRSKPNPYSFKGNQQQPKSVSLFGNDDDNSRPNSVYADKTDQRTSYVPAKASTATVPSKEPEAAPVYRRAKPPRGPQSSVVAPANTQSSMQRVGTDSSNNNSRPTSGAYTSRPSTVDEANVRLAAVPDKTNPQLQEALENSSQAMALMEISYGKLIVLGYPMEEPGVSNSFVSKQHSSRGRLLPIHFAINIQVFSSIAGYDNKYQFVSFKRLCHVVIWLCENKIGTSNAQVMKIVKSIDQEVGTNVTIAKQLLQLAQAAGEMNAELSSITPTSLTTGFGYNVCLLLSHFVDCALKASNFIPQPTLHAQLDDEKEVGPDEAEDSMEEDNISVDEDDHKEDLGTNDINNSQWSVSMDRGKAHAPEYITQHRIDPKLWKEETERVTPLLRKQEVQFMASASSTWQHHVEMLIQYCTQHLQHLKEQKKKDAANPIVVDPLEKPLGKFVGNTVPSPVYTQSPLMESVQQLRAILQAELKKVVLSERYVNTQPNFDQLSRDFSMFKSECTKLEAFSQQSSQQVGTLTSSLAELEEQLDETQRLLQSKMNGEDDKGNNSVVRLKEAIQTLKQEINDMILSIGFNNHELLAKHKQQVMNSIQLRQRKLKKSSKATIGQRGIADDDEGYHS